MNKMFLNATFLAMAFALFVVPAANAAEVRIGAGEYSKLSKEQKDKLLSELRSSGLVGKSDKLVPQAGYAPEIVDTSKVVKGSKSDTCIKGCDSDLGEAKAVCLIAMFFGQKDTCEYIIEGVGAACKAACILP